ETRPARTVGVRRGGGIVSLVATTKTPEDSASTAAVARREDEVDEARAAEREEERRLCTAAQGGDKKALAALLRKYGPILYRTVLLPRLGSEAAAQDALADTYMRVVERFHQFEWRGCGVYPWLRVVAMRIALDALRARKRETLFEPADLARAVERAESDEREGIDDVLCQKNDLAAARQRLDEALGSINSRYAKAIRLRVLEEKTREEAAAALGVTVSTFDVVLHRAMTSLKKHIRAARSDADGEQA
ncbi:MAG: sigma-70 family RNA polymerase sigma factor, partial [Myxococcota bacterium]